MTRKIVNLAPEVVFYFYFIRVLRCAVVVSYNKNDQTKFVCWKYKLLQTILSNFCV